MEIDFVILWVDGKDPIWQQEYIRFSEMDGDKREIRFRDWDNLEYWFRGVEKFTPWVNKIHFITVGHIPSWLNINNPRLNIVKHTDFIPEEILPTFNSNTIEAFLHRIDGLSEHFVLFNDDFFIIKELRPERFFKKGLPCDMGVLNVIVPQDNMSLTLFNNTKLINEYFNKYDVLKRNISKWFNLKYRGLFFKNCILLPWKSFTGFHHAHFPQPFLKTTFEEIWNKNIIPKETCTKFRNKNNYTQYLVSSWQLVSGRFHPFNLYKDSKYFNITNKDLHDIEITIKKQSKKIVVLNDGDPLVNFENAQKIINDSFEQILPSKSSFEL